MVLLRRNIGVQAGSSRSHVRRGVEALILCFFALFPALSRAQSITGDAVVTVYDNTGAVIPNASLTLTQVDTSQATKLQSDTSGIAVFSQLKPGLYKLTSSVPSFATSQLDNITIVIGQRVALEVHMSAGSVQDTVTVSAAGATLLNSESAAVGQAITQRTIKELPLNGRNFIQLTQLTTGAAPVGQGNSPSTTWTGRSDTTVSFAGLRESDTSYLVNGIETRNSRFGNTGIRPSVDTIQEFRVQRTTFGAEFGHSASIINTDLLAGSNTYHLVFFELNRNRYLAANDYFSDQSKTPQPALNQNNFGTTLSGPVVIPKLYNGKDKSFFMFNYEGFRQRQGVPLTGIYPSLAQLNGNLADDSAGIGLVPTDSPFCTASASSPKCVNVSNPLTGEPFAGNVIPTAQLDPTAQKAIPYIPTPNVAVASETAFPSYNTLESPKHIQNIDQYNARIDQKVTERVSLAGNKLHPEPFEVAVVQWK